MTDRELLEMAAKAAGIALRHWDAHYGRFCKEPADKNDTRNYWNPITDDGDALRLAVKLEMQIEYLEFSGNARARARGMRGETEWIVEYCTGPSLEVKDPYAATRRAIVRAAAEIGKAMP